jgi:RNA polymerase subunit RPABC4/transcription elongation factor Spt4
VIEHDADVYRHRCPVCGRSTWTRNYMDPVVEPEPFEGES